MTITCKKCTVLITGPDAPPNILDREERAASEFGALYPYMAAHIQKEHGDDLPMITALIDQYALAVMCKMFTASDKLTYEEMAARARAAGWVTLCQTWNIFPGIVSPADVGNDVQKSYCRKRPLILDVPFSK